MALGDADEAVLDGTEELVAGCSHPDSRMTTVTIPTAEGPVMRLINMSLDTFLNVI